MWFPVPSNAGTGEAMSGVHPQVSSRVCRPLQAAALAPDCRDVSARLLEATLSSFARWLDTYAAPEEALPAACSKLCPQVDTVLRVAIEGVAATLTRFPHEAAMHMVAVDTLLHTLVCRPQRCAAISAIPVWRELQQAVCATGADAPLRGVLSHVQRVLVSTVCSVAVRSQPMPRTERGVPGVAEEAARQHVLLLQQLLAPSLDLLLQFGAAGGPASTKATAVTSVAGNAQVVRSPANCSCEHTCGVCAPALQLQAYVPGCDGWCSIPRAQATGLLPLFA